MKLNEFAEKERLKDHLLYIIRQDKEDRVGLAAIEPTSDILIKVFDIYGEILKEEGVDSAGNYLFNLMASYVLVSVQLIDMNRQLVDLNTKLMEKLED